MFLALTDPWDAGLPMWLMAILRLSVAAALGGVIGLEREIRGRDAGFRTYMLVCVGSALVMIVSIQFAFHPWQAPPGVTINVDPARIAYGVMTGVGFLGAGTIVQNRGTIRGLTTAAGIWCVAAMGLAVGFGLYLLSALVAVLIFVALFLLDYAAALLPRLRHRTIVLRTTYGPGCIARAVERCKKAGVGVIDVTFERTSDLIHADLFMRVEFSSNKQYYGLEREFEVDDEFKLLAAREV